MFDRRDHDRQTNFVHENPSKVDGGHTIRSECVRRNCICAVLESSSKNEEDGNQTGLNDETRLKEDTAEDRIRSTEDACKFSVWDESNVRRNEIFMLRLEYVRCLNITLYCCSGFEIESM